MFRQMWATNMRKLEDRPVNSRLSCPLISSTSPYWNVDAYQISQMIRRGFYFLWQNGLSHLGILISLFPQMCHLFCFGNVAIHLYFYTSVFLYFDLLLPPKCCDNDWAFVFVFSCPGSSISDLGQSLDQWVTATFEFWHKEWLLRLETLQTFDQHDV